MSKHYYLENIENHYGGFSRQLLKYVTSLHRLQHFLCMRYKEAKAQINELFLKWLSLTDTQQEIKNYMAQQQETRNYVEHIQIGTRNGSPTSRKQLSPIHINGSTSPKSPLSPRLSVDEVDVTANNLQQRLSISHQQNKQQQQQQLSSSPSSTPQTPPRSPSSSRNNFSFCFLNYPESRVVRLHYSLGPKTLISFLLVAILHWATLHQKKKIKISTEDVIIFSATPPSSDFTSKAQQPYKPKISVESLIPQFYFPSGALSAPQQNLKQDLLKIKEYFLKSFGGFSIEQFRSVTTELCQMPYFFTTMLYKRIDRKNIGRITCEMFEQFWKEDMFGRTEPERIFRILKQPGNQFILPSDFKPMMKELLISHPGLEFLKSTPAFQEKYAETVIVRIFYTVNRNGTGKISLREFKNSKLVDSIKFIEQEEDINQELNFFSYEHFYVIYCKFWELDTDHDFIIDRTDLLNYGENSLTEHIVDRIIEARMAQSNTEQGKMSYDDFIWFCLSEEDKTTPTALEYWFRLIDIDADGIISEYEIEYFFSQQRERMEQIDAQPVSFEDIRTQIIDMIKPQNPNFITLRDIKASKMSPIFFNILFNLNKFFLFEQKGTLGSLGNWATYARQEYDRMAMEDEEGEEYFEEEDAGIAESEDHNEDEDDVMQEDITNFDEHGMERRHVK